MTVIWPGSVTGTVRSLSLTVLSVSGAIFYSSRISHRMYVHVAYIGFRIHCVYYMNLIDDVTPSQKRSGSVPVGSEQASGFALLEILVALMILMIGLTSVILVFAQGVTLQARSRHDLDSARLAQSVISEIQFLADEYNRLPEEDSISSHAGFSDRYDVDLKIEEMDTRPDDVTGAISYANQPHRVNVTITTTFRGSEQKDTYNTAVVVSN